MTSEIKEGILFGLGNPLLDISANVDHEFLKKYELKENDQILASEKHTDLYEEMSKKYDVSYSPGGATLNSIRVAQWMLKKPKTAVFTGCISKDHHGKILEEIVTKEGIVANYKYIDHEKTGTCAVLITGNSKFRSLVAYLGAANMFTRDHLDNITKMIDQAGIFYMAGYPLTVCPPAMMELGRNAAKEGKTLCMNLSAPFLPQFFKKPLEEIMPYVDFLFGNEADFASFGTNFNLESKDLKKLSLQVSALPKENKKKKRVVIITQGSHPTLVSQDGNVTEFPVLKINDDEIVDTNGAGDSFVGGFLAGLVLGLSLDKCVEAAHYAANYILKQPGVVLPTPSTFQF